MRYTVGVLVVFLMQFAATSPGLSWTAGEKFPPIPDADEIIAHCRAISENEQANMGAGAFVARELLDTVDCVEDAIKENFRILVDEESIPGPPLNSLMHDLKESFLDFHYYVYSYAKACKPNCGNLGLASAASQLDQLYELLLRTVLAERKDREF